MPPNDPGLSKLNSSAIVMPCKSLSELPGWFFQKLEIDLNFAFFLGVPKLSVSLSFLLGVFLKPSRVVDSLAKTN